MQKTRQLYDVFLHTLCNGIFGSMYIKVLGAAAYIYLLLFDGHEPILVR